MPNELPNTDPGPEPRRACAAALQAALGKDGEVGLTRLLEASEAAARLLPETSRHRRRLLAFAREQRARAESDSAAVLADTRRGLEALVLDLAFEPRIEAPVPDGWPAPTPVRELRVVDYPAYRLARTPMRGFPSTNNAFWKLFRHIQSREIAMTAPVETTYGGAPGRESAESMAFLYRSTEQGALGQDGDVEIVDLPAARVLSIGVRGSLGGREVLGARAELDSWLAENPSWEACGALRTMGWNSPMTGEARRYWEVQLPVRLKPESAR